MIRESSVGLAEMIAVAKPNFRPSEIIQGLNGVSIGLESYTDGFRKEIAYVTASDETEHTNILDVGSTRLAEIIRGAMENISAYGKPLAVAISKEAEVCYSQAMLRDIANANFKHQFVWLDDPFFDSSIYPTEVKDKSFTYTNVALPSLDRLQFDYPEDSKVVSFVNSNHSDVVEVMRERDYSQGGAAYALVDKENLEDMFVRASNGNFDFSRVKRLDSEKVLKMYIILTKMYSSDDPCPWLKAGTLEDYREFVTTLWNALTCYLINLKVLVHNYRNNGLSIVDNGAVRLVDGKGEEQAGVRFLEADTVVFYTDAVMEGILAADCSLSEVMLGYYWERLTGDRKNPSDIVANPTHFQAKAHQYYTYVNEKLSKHAEARFVKGGLKTILEFILSNENVSGRLAEVRGDSADMLGTWVRDTFTIELERCFRQLNGSGYEFGAVVEAGEDGPSMADIVMSSHIVPVFLRQLKCNMAADLLEDTFVTQASDDNVVDQRERLTVSVVNLIVGLSLS